MNEEMAKVRTLAVDLAKHVFQVAGEDAHGSVVFEARLKSREAFQEFRHTLSPPLVVWMQTGPGAQSWGLEAWGRAAETRSMTCYCLSR
nr:hypothetical protein [Nitrosomonas nitrosa]